MQITKFALGVRFAAMAEQPPKDFARKIFEGIFSVLTLSELEGLTLFGGADPYTGSLHDGEEGDVYLVVLMGGKLKQMRKVYNAIASDAALEMYLVHARPFIENNRLSAIEGLDFFGHIRSNGRVEGGDGTLDGLSVPKKRGRRKPVGKGIRVLLAPEDYEHMGSTEAIKRMTVAARRHFQGVKLAPFPVCRGGVGFVASLVSACGGAERKLSITAPEGGEKRQIYYGVLRGKTAVIETACALPAGEYGPAASSIGVGETLRRALDEGLKSILAGVHDFNMADGGMGCARALGVRFFDQNGQELSCGADKLKSIASADVEYLHPRLREISLLAMADNAPGEIVEGMDRLCSALGAALQTEIRPREGFMGVLCALTGGRRAEGYDELLQAVDFTRILKDTALVVTGCSRLDAAAMEGNSPLFAIVNRCARASIPVAMVVGEMGDGAARLYSLCNAGVMTLERDNAGDEALRFDRAADRMFRFIRMGRDVEKIGAPKKPRVKSWYKLWLESWPNRHDNLSSRQ